MTVGRLKVLLADEDDECEIKIGINPGQGADEEVFEIEDLGYSHSHQCLVIWQE